VKTVNAQKGEVTVSSGGERKRSPARLLGGKDHQVPSSKTAQEEKRRLKVVRKIANERVARTRK